MFEPGRKNQELAGCWGDGNAHTGPDPGQFDPRSFVHGHRRAARIAEVNFAAFHRCRHFHIIGSREETARVRMECVEVTRLVDIDPATQPKLVFFLAFFGTEVIKECLNMLLHLATKFLHDLFLQVEKIKRIMPAAEVCAASGIFGIGHQRSGKLFQVRVQMDRAVVALVNPGREERQDADFDSRSWHRLYA